MDKTNNTPNTAPKVTKETKNKIRVDFERTSFWTRFKIKYLQSGFVVNVLFKIARFCLLLGIAYVILMPFFTKISSSFMSGEDFVDVTVKLIPKYPTLDTYKAIITDNGYFQALFNTVLLSLMCAVIQTLICAMIAYGFAKFKFKGNGILFAIVILTMVVPHQTLQFSMFMRFRYFDFLGTLNIFNLIPMPTANMTNTFWPLALLSFTGLGFKNGLYIFMLRQYFKGVPDELEESAYLDGYGPFETFVKIILPLSIPMLITVFLFAFSWQWTDNFYSTLFFATKDTLLMPDIVTLPKSLDIASYDVKQYSAAVNNGCAMLIIAPLIIIYLFCQKYMVQGIERSGITG